MAQSSGFGADVRGLRGLIYEDRAVAQVEAMRLAVLLGHVIEWGVPTRRTQGGSCAGCTRGCFLERRRDGRWSVTGGVMRVPCPGAITRRVAAIASGVHAGPCPACGSGPIVGPGTPVDAPVDLVEESVVEGPRYAQTTTPARNRVVEPVREGVTGPWTKKTVESRHAHDVRQQPTAALPPKGAIALAALASVLGGHYWGRR